MEIPAPGEVVPNYIVEKICLELGFDDLWRKIWSDPPEKPFSSDGCSLWPDKWKGHDLYFACFKHDIKYWCGYIGEDVERLKADLELVIDVLEITRDCHLAMLMFRGVRAGGHEIFKRSFSWSYGRM